MKKIIIKDKFSNITREVTQFKTVEDVNKHIDLEVEFADVHEDVRQIKKDRRGYGADAIDHLMDMYKNINNKTSSIIILPGGTITFNGFYDKALMNRKDILEMKREQMIECVNKYGEVWMNVNGTYCPPLKNHEIV